MSLTLSLICSIVLVLIPVIMLWMWNNEDPK